jgi:hypothetical protein
MSLGAFSLNKAGLRARLRADRKQRSGSPDMTGWTGWDPLELGAETDVMELLASAQREQLLTGPAQVGLIYLDDPNGGAYHVTVGLKLGDEDDQVLRLASPACDWDTIARDGHSGIEAAIAVLDGITTEANRLLRHLEHFMAPYEQASYDRAMDDSLEVTDGIEAYDVCGCGDPIALYDGQWTHVYNDRLRGTDDHVPAPG